MFEVGADGNLKMQAKEGKAKATGTLKEIKKLIEPVEPVEPVPVEPVQPEEIDTVEIQEPPEPSELTEPMEPMEPMEPIESTPMQQAPVQEQPELTPELTPEQTKIDLNVVLKSGRTVRIPIFIAEIEEMETQIDTARLHNLIFRVGDISIIASQIELYYLEERPVK